MLIGLITSIIAGIRALFELDLKKVVALSTLRQLGVIFFCLGITQPLLVFNHLISHAYFKAILFIAAGGIIHRIKDYQDIRKRGGFFFNSPFISRILLIRRLRLSGLPFLRGFYSKDIIIEYYFSINNNLMLIFLIITATLLTAIYSCRLIIILFRKNSQRESFSREIDVDNFMKIGIIILFFPSIIGGQILRFFSISSTTIYFPLWIKVLIFFFIIFFSFYFLSIKFTNFKPASLLTKGINQIWFLPNFIRPIFTKIFINNSKIIIKFIDASWTPLIFFKWLNYVYIYSFYFNSIINTKLIVRISFFLILLIF